MPGADLGDAPGWWMKSSPLLRSWPRVVLAGVVERPRISSASSFELYAETWPSSSWQQVIVPFGLRAARHGCHGHSVVNRPPGAHGRADARSAGDGHRLRRRVQRRCRLQPAQEGQRSRRRSCAAGRRPRPRGRPWPGGAPPGRARARPAPAGSGDGLGRQQRGDAIAGGPPDRGQRRPQRLALGRPPIARTRSRPRPRRRARGARSASSPTSGSTLLVLRAGRAAPARRTRRRRPAARRTRPARCRRRRTAAGCSTPASIAWRRARRPPPPARPRRRPPAARWSRSARRWPRASTSSPAEPRGAAPACGPARRRSAHQRAHRTQQHLRRDGAVPLVALEPEGHVVAPGLAQRGRVDAPSRIRPRGSGSRPARPPSAGACPRSSSRPQSASRPAPAASRPGSPARTARARASSSASSSDTSRGSHHGVDAHGPTAGPVRPAAAAACSASSSAKRSMRAGRSTGRRQRGGRRTAPARPAHALSPACRS